MINLIWYKIKNFFKRYKNNLRYFDAIEFFFFFFLKLISRFILTLILAKYLSNWFGFFILKYDYFEPRLLALLFLNFIFHLPFLPNARHHKFIWVSPLSLFFTIPAFFKTSWYNKLMFDENNNRKGTGFFNYLRGLILFFFYFTVFVINNIDILKEKCLFFSQLSLESNIQDIIAALFTFIVNVNNWNFLLVIFLLWLYIYILIKIYPNTNRNIIFNEDANYFFIFMSFITIFVALYYIPAIFTNVYGMNIFSTGFNFYKELFNTLMKWIFYGSKIL